MEKLRPSPDVDWIELDGELIVRRASSGDVHLLNSSAAVLWPLFDGETTIEDLADDVADFFAISRTQALSDITTFTEEMRGRHLLTSGHEASVPALQPEPTGGPRYLPTPPDP